MFQIVMAGFIFMILYVMYLAVKKDDYAPRQSKKFDPRQNRAEGQDNQTAKNKTGKTRSKSGRNVS
tara:strand:- start:10057 stop:10254 length:198 start_codon:yes stop_codon:yes gene_type:complete